MVLSTPLCRACKHPLEHIMADLGVSPLANSLIPPERLHLGEMFYPLCARICERCYLVQLDTETPPQAIFEDYLYFSSYSPSWLRHAETYTESMIARYALQPGTHQIIEVASNDGYLLQYFAQAGFEVLGIEPAQNVAAVAREKGIPTLSRFLNLELVSEMTAAGQQADLLIANNVLAHVPQLHEFVASLAQLLKPSGILTLEFPHLEALLREGQFDTIYHEHFSYFSLLSVQQVLQAHQLHVIDVEVLKSHGGSLRLHVSHVTSPQAISARVAEWQTHEHAAGLDQLATYLSFDQRIRAIRRAFTGFIQDLGPGQLVAYGAPAKGNTFLNYCGIHRQDIAYTVDRNPHKQGMALPGSRIPVLAPEQLEQNPPPFVLILPWNLSAEIQAQLQPLRGQGTRFVTAIPELRIV